MGHVRFSEHIDAPIDHVWEINPSCERLPERNKPRAFALKLFGAGGAKGTVDRHD